MASYHWTGLETMRYPGGTVRELAYDPLMRLTAIRVEDPDGGAMLDYGYSYDGIGNILAKTTEHGDYQFGYDDLKRLTMARGPLANEAWTYDPNGNRISDLEHPGDWSYDENDRLLQSPVGNFAYDESGRLVRREQGEERLDYEYDAAGRLRRVSDATGTTLAEYRYDPLGRRTAKTVGGTTSYFHYTDEGLADEYSADGSLIRSYGFAPGGIWNTNPLYGFVDGGYVYYHNDHLGTPWKLTRANGQVVWSGRYRAFGSMDADTEAVENLLGFPRQIWDVEIGAYHNYFREYDPQVGRYSTGDPIRLAGGLNLYGYAAGNPLFWIDPSGLTASCPLAPPRNSSVLPPYVGLPKVFHCGFEGYLEVREDKRDESKIQECFFDKSRVLVDESHEYSGCRGTPDEYPARDPRHWFVDEGGIARAGPRSALESARYIYDQRVYQQQDSSERARAAIMMSARGISELKRRRTLHGPQRWLSADTGWKVECILMADPSFAEAFGSIIR